MKKRGAKPGRRPVKARVQARTSPAKAKQRPAKDKQRPAKARQRAAKARQRPVQAKQRRAKARTSPAKVGRGPGTVRLSPAKARKRPVKPRKAATASAKPPATSRKPRERVTRRAPAAKQRGHTARPRPGPVPRATPETETGRVTQLPEEMARYHETSPALSGGDLDADWTRSEGAGEETVGGSVATPDQDVVDEIGRALGVEQDSDEPVRTSGEILRERAEHRWAIERAAAEEDERRER